MKHYTESEIVTLLPGWQYINTGIEKEFLFKDFSAAFAFMTQIALYCEKMYIFTRTYYLEQTAPVP